MNTNDEHFPLVETRRGRILVVDDEEKNRILLRDLLEVQGYEVTLAEDGEQALEKAFATSPDVVLLDIMMPGLNGYDVCRRLRQDSRTSHLPILMITALRERSDRLEGIQAGANDFLTKPIDAEEIRLRVKNAVYANRLYDKVLEDNIRLKELELLRDNLTNMIVHDMRSPLQVVSGSCEIISSELDRLSPRQKELLTMGQCACNNLTEMVRSLLDICRIEAGKMPINRTPCDLLEIAQKAAASVAVLARQKKVVIQVGGDSTSSGMDRDIIHRVFVNLLGNALKFSPIGGTVQVDISSTLESVRASVKDQGPGIPPEYHKKIFEKFGQVESRKEGQMHSTGLGLTFCKLAVEAHGGHIGVESPSTGLPPSPGGFRLRKDASPGQAGEASRAGEVGKGSTFWFTMPAAPSEGQSLA